MSNIRITMKDGTVHDFPHVGRLGGSYSKSIKYEGGFAIVTDEEYQKTAFASGDIAKVEEWPSRGWS